MSLPIERILWAPTNSAHDNHLHVVGKPRMAQWELPTNGIWTPSINVIVDALDARFGQGEHFIINPDAAWTHMGVYNPRYIAGTKTWSQHAGANAIDIGPYYGQAEQQIFYDFLTGKEETVMALSKGSKGHTVGEVQKALLNWRDNALPEWGADEDFGGETEEWVIKFQKAAELRATGVVDGVTFGMLNRYMPWRHPASTGTVDTTARSRASKALTLSRDIKSKLGALY